jgi:multidrug efflux pump subunit AcrB
MISSVFIDRPRLAIVIAIVITVGGFLALTRIPVAQLPDIVPPQVQVTAIYPGASAEVLEATVAQPLEAKIVGVDKMIYMKSTSGNDGSYTLTVSFELGSDPDIDTVNVNNRVQTAISQLPQEVQLQGITVQKQSSSILQFVMLYSENGNTTRFSSPTTRSSTWLTSCRARRASARPICSPWTITRCASGSTRRA